MEPIHLTNVYLNNEIFEGPVDVYISRYRVDLSLAMILVVPGTKKILTHVSIWKDPNTNPVPHRGIHVYVPESVFQDLINKGVLQLIEGLTPRALVLAPQHIWDQFDDQNPSLH